MTQRRCDACNFPLPSWHNPDAVLCDLCTGIPWDKIQGQHKGLIRAVAYVANWIVDQLG